jgi:hypothetical protein
MKHSSSRQRSWTFAALLVLVAPVAGCGPSTQSIGPSSQASAVVATASPSATASPTTPTASAAVATGQILFTRTYQGDQQAIFAADADGSNEQRLTAPGDYCCLLRVSPDRTRILVMPGQDPLPTPVTGGTLAIDGSGFVKLALKDPSLNLVPQAWSPDGTRIAFEGWDDSQPSRTGVYTARASDIGDLVRVTTAPGAPNDIPLAYSPDGRQLVFYRAIRVEPGDLPADIGGSLWVVNVDGSKAHQIKTPGTAPGWWARWSPDGTKILFATERLRPDGALWTVRPDGSGLTKLFKDSNGRFPSGPTWSPDGSKIMFNLNPVSDTFLHVPNELYVINADGTGLTLVIGGSDFKGQPEWWR